MDKIVFGIVNAFLYPEHVLESEHFQVTQTSEVLYRKIMAMPALLRLAMTAAVHVFNAAGIMAGGAFFEHLDLNGQKKQLRQWSASPIRPCREVMAFFQKMSIFIYYSLCRK